jgi:hypothetical protein
VAQTDAVSIVFLAFLKGLGERSKRCSEAE